MPATRWPIAAAHAVIDIMAEEKLPERGAQARRQAEGRADSAARRACRRSPTCAAWAPWSRWSSTAPAPTEPDADFTKRVQAQALQRGLILLTCGVNANVLRFLFPLTISDALFDEALGILNESFRSA